MSQPGWEGEKVLEPKCSDCVHSGVQTLIGGVVRIMPPPLMCDWMKNRNYGEPWDRRYAWEMRDADNDFCGPDGKWFEPKTKPALECVSLRLVITQTVRGDYMVKMSNDAAGTSSNTVEQRYTKAIVSALGFAEEELAQWTHMMQIKGKL